MYIDPNTGGMLFQILAVAFTALSGIVLLFSGKIRMLWARITRRKLEEQKSQTQDDANESS